ncbi:MAG: ABC transporter ATP-binding protein [Rectinemataceae bacterium]
MSIPTERITELRAEGITKRFPGITACDGISLRVGRGEVLALVGENGAGKTTLMNILMGLYQPDEGKLFINGKPVRFRSPNDAYAAGIGMVHQHFMLVPNMTVAENVALGSKDLRKAFRLDMEEARRRIRDVSERYSLPVQSDAYIWQLSVGEQQRVELVKTLCFGARFLILDEPTSALTPQETDELIALLSRMAGDMSIIFISHKLAEVKALSDKITVLRHGKVVFNGDTADHSPADLAALMTGHEVVLPHNECAEGCGEVLLSVKGLKVRSDRGHLALDGADLEVRAGEILGLAGVSGNGQRELADALAGLRKPESGSIRLGGKELAGHSPREIIGAGMGYIPEDRNTEGIVPSMSVKENLTLKDFASKEFAAGPFLKLKKAERNAVDLKERYDIRCPSISTAAGSLSGGNIQKVILARELARAPKVLVAVYPTRGLDMGAEEFIHKRLLDLRREGVAVLLISEELDELMNLSDRIAVIFKGKVLKTMPAREATRRHLGILMAGIREEEDAREQDL